MKSLEEQMAVYAAYHRNPMNRMTHFAGVPLIMFSLLVLLSWPALPVFGIRVSLAVVLAVAVLVYYFLLDVAMAAAMTVFIGLLLTLAYWIATSFPGAVVWAVFAACFVCGWILQLVGHVFEGRRPALADNIWQVFVAPIFLMAEVFFAAGFRRDVRDRLQRRLDDNPGTG